MTLTDSGSDTAYYCGRGSLVKIRGLKISGSAHLFRWGGCRLCTSFPAVIVNTTYLQSVSVTRQHVRPRDVNRITSPEGAACTANRATGMAALGQNKGCCRTPEFDLAVPIQRPVRTPHE